MKSNGFLKVVGILMIIGGGANIILGLILVLGASALAIVLGGEANSGMLVFSSLLVLLSGAISLVAGILGVKNAAKPEKAGSCIVFGILTALICILSNVLRMAGGGSLSVPSLILGLALPVLYLIGAFQSKSSSVA